MEEHFFPVVAPDEPEAPVTNHLRDCAASHTIPLIDPLPRGQSDCKPDLQSKALTLRASPSRPRTVQRHWKGTPVTMRRL